MAVVLITGGNRGIGLELCRQYHARGDDVIAVCRNASEELTALGVRVIDNIDVADGDDVAKLVGQLDGADLDVLVNNAGILHSDTIENVDFEHMLEQYRVNTIGPLRVTRALRSNLRSRWPWLAAAIALVMFAPYIVWNLRRSLDEIWPEIKSFG